MTLKGDLKCHHEIGYFIRCAKFVSFMKACEMNSDTLRKNTNKHDTTSILNSASFDQGLFQAAGEFHLHRLRLQLYEKKNISIVICSVFYVVQESG